MKARMMLKATRQLKPLNHDHHPAPQLTWNPNLCLIDYGSSSRQRTPNPCL